MARCRRIGGLKCHRGNLDFLHTCPFLGRNGTVPPAFVFCRAPLLTALLYRHPRWTFYLVCARTNAQWRYISVDFPREAILRCMSRRCMPSTLPSGPYTNHPYTTREKSTYLKRCAHDRSQFARSPIMRIKPKGSPALTLQSTVR